MRALRVLLLAMILLPVGANLAPASSASACADNQGPVDILDAIWAREYAACNSGFDTVNRLCHYCLA